MTRLTLLAPLLIVAAQHAAAEPLTGKELERRLGGHTWVWTSKKFETSGVSTYFRDGRMTVKVDGFDRPERGQWQVKEDKVCVTLIGNRESCSGTIIQLDDDTLFSESTQTTFVRQD